MASHSQHQPQPQQSPPLEEGILKFQDGRIILGTLRWNARTQYANSDARTEDHRRRLIWMQRWFDGSYRATDLSRVSPFVWGCKFFGFGPQIGQGKRYEWNDFDTSYWPDYRYKVMLEEMSGRNEKLKQKLKKKERKKLENKLEKFEGKLKKKFVRFSVIITSMPWIRGLGIEFHEILGLPDELPGELPVPNPYRRYGYHLYMTCNGTLLSGLLYLTRHGLFQCYGGSGAPIHNIYPVIRYQWQSKHQKSALTYGLAFDLCENRAEEASASGDRYYHRLTNVSEPEMCSN